MPPPAGARTIVYCDGATTVYCNGATTVGARAAEEGATAGAHAALAYAEGSLSPRSPPMGAQNARRAEKAARRHAQAVRYLGRCSMLLAWRPSPGTCATPGTPHMRRLALLDQGTSAGS